MEIARAAILCRFPSQTIRLDYVTLNCVHLPRSIPNHHRGLDLYPIGRAARHPFLVSILGPYLYPTDSELLMVDAVDNRLVFTLSSGHTMLD